VQVPVDPGPVQVVASAAGYKTVKLSVEISAKRDKRTLTIPKLEKMDKAAAAEAAEPAETSAAAATPESKEPEAKKEKAPESTEERKAAPEPPPMEAPEIVGEGPGKTPWIIGGLGVAAGATGGLFGYLAIQSNNDAKNLCPTRQHCSSSALDAVDRRNQQAMIANIGVGVGIVGVATAAVWLLVGGPKSQDSDSAKVVVRPSVTSDTALLWASGKF
jgi:hypothetical protein